jgi:hypothetical protein
MSNISLNIFELIIYNKFKNYFNFNTNIIMDQNNIILVLLLIAVLVAFYAIYLGMENSKRIKKISLELNDTLKLLDESTRIRQPQMPEHPTEPDQKPSDELDEYPSLEEINNQTFDNPNGENTLEPLEENLKNQIDNLDHLTEEQLLMLEKRLENEDELMELRNISNLEEINRENDNAFQEENLDFPVEENLDFPVEENLDFHSNTVVENAGEEAGEDAGEDDGEDAGEDDGEDAGEDAGEDDGEDAGEDDGEDAGEEGGVEGVVEDAGTNKYPNLEDLVESVLNQYNCEELREICKREELRTRGRKSELVDRILKKKEALA